MTREATVGDRTAGDRLTTDVDVIVEPGVSLEIAASELVSITEHVLRREGARGAWSVAIVITTDDHLRRLHREFMGIDTETDVMTFPAEPAPGEETIGGDIVISADRAADQAHEYGHSPSEEIRFLAVHGLLHLIGWSDETDTGRTAMLDRQRQLIEEALGSDNA